MDQCYPKEGDVPMMTKMEKLEKKRRQEQQERTSNLSQKPKGSKSKGKLDYFSLP
jgi:hypothetical protein